jgi:putative redox protein
MKIELLRRNQAIHFEAVNEAGMSLHMDGGEQYGGEGKGMRPMEALLAAFAGCSALDIVIILKKMKQDLKDMKVSIEGEREEIEKVKPFKKIHLHFSLYGEIKESKAEKAVSVSVEKYCSVGASLDPTIKISYGFEIIPA